MADEDVLIRFKADSSQYAAQARRVRNDLISFDRMQQRQKERTQQLERLNRRQAELARRERMERFRALSIDERQLLVRRRLERVERAINAATVQGNSLRLAALRVRQMELRTTEAQLVREAAVSRRRGLGRLIPGFRGAASVPGLIGGAAVLGARRMVSSAMADQMNVDPGLQKLNEQIEKMGYASDQTFGALQRLNKGFMALRFVVRVFSNQIVGQTVRQMEMAAGGLIAMAGRFLQLIPSWAPGRFGMSKESGVAMESMGQEMLAKGLYGDLGERGVADAEGRLQEALKDKKNDRKFKAPRVGFSGAGSPGESAGLYVQSAGATLAREQVQIARQSYMALKDIRVNTAKAAFEAAKANN